MSEGRRGRPLTRSGDPGGRRLAYKQGSSFREKDLLRLTACACGSDYLVQTDKGPWMRLFRMRAHYYCVKCRTRQFLPENRRVSWSVSRIDIDAALQADSVASRERTPARSAAEATR